MPPKIAITFPRLGFGGSEHVCLSIVEALQQDFRVTLVTGTTRGEAVDLEPVSRFCQCAVDLERVELLTVPIPALIWGRFAALRGAYFEKRCRPLARSFDLMFSSYGPVDFGVPGVQYIHDPSFTTERLQELRQGSSGIQEAFYRDSVARRAYLGLSHLLRGGDSAGARKNLTLTNSRWTGARIENALGIKPVVVYPPVRAEFPAVPWEQRRDGFICVGRWTREKRMERVIRIVAKVREKGFKVDLHMMGNRGDRNYFRELQRASSESGGWITVHDGIASPEKVALIAGSKFGISGRPSEPFGIALAEMVKSGCITFVPNSGGQTEIVDHPLLAFDDEEDAARKICTVLASESLQQTLRTHLDTAAQRFSAAEFMRSIRGIVQESLQQNVAAAKAN